MPRPVSFGGKKLKGRPSSSGRKYGTTKKDPAVSAPKATQGKTRKPRKATQGAAVNAQPITPPATPVQPPINHAGRTRGIAKPSAPKRVAPKPTMANRIGKGLGVKPITTTGRGFVAGTANGKGLTDNKGRFTMQRHLKLAGTRHFTAKANNQRMNVTTEDMHQGGSNTTMIRRKGAGVVSTGTIKAQQAQNAVSAPARSAASLQVKMNRVKAKSQGMKPGMPKAKMGAPMASPTMAPGMKHTSSSMQALHKVGFPQAKAMADEANKKEGRI